MRGGAATIGPITGIDGISLLNFVPEYSLVVLLCESCCILDKIKPEYRRKKQASTMDGLVLCVLD